LGYYERDKLIYAGKVGTGFGERLGSDFIAKSLTHNLVPAITA
jgi:hypothetical protein